MGILVVNSDPAALWGKVYIQFADPAVKAICAENWGSDGEITDEQAAAVTDLGDAFKGNADITSFDELRYFTGLTSIGIQAFYGCTALTSVTIPDSVTSIGNRAFFNCTSLTSVVIPEGVTSIDTEAFYGCTRLSVVTFPSTLTTIGKSAFGACEGLTTIDLSGTSVITLTERAFVGCNHVTSYDLPSTLTTVGSSAIGEASTLMSVTCRAVTPPSKAGKWGTVNSSMCIYVPAESVDAYKADANWSTRPFSSQVIPVVAIPTE